MHKSVLLQSDKDRVYGRPIRVLSYPAFDERVTRGNCGIALSEAGLNINSRGTGLDQSKYRRYKSECG